MFPARSTTLDDFEVLGRIGEGAFSEVHRARHRASGLMVYYSSTSQKQSIYCLMDMRRIFCEGSPCTAASDGMLYFVGQVFTMKRVRLRDPKTGICHVSLLLLLLVATPQTVQKPGTKPVNIIQ